MKYSPSNPVDVTRAREYLEQLLKGKRTVEVKAISPRRSLSQNAYLHTLLAAYGSHFGFSMDEAKYLYKYLNKDIYAYEKGGVTFLRSSADLDTAEMTRSIEKFREHSAEQDYPLPSATDTQWLTELDNIIEQTKYYL